MRRANFSSIFLRALLPASACLSLARPAAAVPLPPEAPKLSLEIESQFAQPNAASSRGFGAAFWAAYRFTDQLSVTGAVSTLVSKSGPFSSAGLGIRALIDTTPVIPFLDVQLVALGPEESTGYTLATRLGGGLDLPVAKGFALGLAVRTLTPFNGSASVSQGIEIALRFVLTPALIN